MDTQVAGGKASHKSLAMYRAAFEFCAEQSATVRLSTLLASGEVGKGCWCASPIL